MISGQFFFTIDTVYPCVLCDAMYNASHNFEVLIACKMLAPMYLVQYQIYYFASKTGRAW